MYFLCGIYRYIEFAADYAYGLYVVGVVVGDEYGTQTSVREAIVCKIFFKSSDAYAEVHKNGLAGSFEVIAVTAAAAAKTEKFQHSDWLMDNCRDFRTQWVESDNFRAKLQNYVAPSVSGFVF